MPPTRTKLPARERGGGGFGVRFLRVFPKEGSGAARSASPRPALPRLRCFRLGGAAAGRLRGALRVSMAKQLPSAFSPVPVVGQLLPFSARRGAVPCVVSCRVVLCVTVSCSCCGIVCEQSRTVTQIPPQPGIGLEAVEEVHASPAALSVCVCGASLRCTGTAMG